MKQTSAFSDCYNAFIDFTVCDCSLKQRVLSFGESFLDILLYFYILCDTIRGLPYSNCAMIT